MPASLPLSLPLSLPRSCPPPQPPPHRQRNFPQRSHRGRCTTPARGNDEDVWHCRSTPDHTTMTRRIGIIGTSTAVARTMASRRRLSPPLLSSWDLFCTVTTVHLATEHHDG